MNTLDYPGQGVKMWIFLYRYHILYQSQKFKTDFLEKMFRMKKSASETEKNNMYVIVIAHAVQKL